MSCHRLNDELTARSSHSAPRLTLSSSFFHRRHPPPAKSSDGLFGSSPQLICDHNNPEPRNSIPAFQNTDEDGENDSGLADHKSFSSSRGSSSTLLTSPSQMMLSPLGEAGNKKTLEQQESGEPNSQTLSKSGGHGGGGGRDQDISSRESSSLAQTTLWATQHDSSCGPISSLSCSDQFSSSPPSSSLMINSNNKVKSAEATSLYGDSSSHNNASGEDASSTSSGPVSSLSQSSDEYKHKVPTTQGKEGEYSSTASSKDNPQSDLQKQRESEKKQGGCQSSSNADKDNSSSSGQRSNAGSSNTNDSFSRELVSSLSHESAATTTHQERQQKSPRAKWQPGGPPTNKTGHDHSQQKVPQNCPCCFEEGNLLSPSVKGEFAHKQDQNCKPAVESAPPACRRSSARSPRAAATSLTTRIGQLPRLFSRSNSRVSSRKSFSGAATDKDNDSRSGYATSFQSLSHHSSQPTRHSTISTTKSFYQILGIKVQKSNEEDSYYSPWSGSQHSINSSFFERFGWYGAVTGIGGFWLACGTLFALLTLLTISTAQVASTRDSSHMSLSTISGAGFPASTNQGLKIVVATRLHNRQATHAMTDDMVQKRIANFADLCRKARCLQGVIGVDAEDAHLLRQVQDAIEASSTPMHALPITPWGRFVPALNALIGYAAALPDSDDMADAILFVSAETTATRESIKTLMRHMVMPPKEESTLASLARLRSSKLTPSGGTATQLDNTTLVVGARLVGHDYHSHMSEIATDDSDHKGVGKGNVIGPLPLGEASAVELNGRTTPWNTLALWNLRKLATTGFLLLSEGYLTNRAEEPSYGVEEVIIIALLQQLLGAQNAVAKLVVVPGVSWDIADFVDDPERHAWHELKTESKLARAERQMKLTNLQGIVHHY